MTNTQAKQKSDDLTLKGRYLANFFFGRVNKLIGIPIDHAYFFLDEDGNIVPQPNSQMPGIYYFAYINSEEPIDFSLYETLDDIGMAILGGACMDTSNVASFEIVASPSKPTLESTYCDHEVFHIEVGVLTDADIKWYDDEDLTNLIWNENGIHMDTAGVYYVTQTLNACESDTLEIEVTEADLVCLGDCPNNLVQNFSFEEYNEEENANHSVVEKVGEKRIFNFECVIFWLFFRFGCITDVGFGWSTNFESVGLGRFH